METSTNQDNGYKSNLCHKIEEYEGIIKGLREQLEIIVNENNRYKEDMERQIESLKQTYDRNIAKLETALEWYKMAK